MTTGRHLIVDVYNIINHRLLETIDGVEPLMKKIINEGKLNAIGEMKHQFEPVGATILYLLSESHISIHTYPEKCYCAIDIYCCKMNYDFNIILDIIYTYFKGDCIILKKIIER